MASKNLTDGVGGKELPADNIALYLKDIKKYPLLSKKQELELAQLVQKGDKAAKDRMIQSNLRLVVTIAKRYQNRGIPLIDLVNEGNLGLIRAVEKFDPTLGFRFSTYSTWWIRQNIERSIMNHSRSIRLPVHIVKKLNKVLKAKATLSLQSFENPKVKDIAKLAKVGVSETYKLLSMQDKVESIDTPIGGDNDLTLGDTISDEEENNPTQIIMQTSSNKKLYEMLEDLDPQAREILERRFGLNGYLDATLEKIGGEVGLTRERVRQIQIDAVQQLKSDFKAHGIDKDAMMF